MANIESRTTKNNNDNGGIDPELVERYLSDKENKEVPHAFNTLFSHKKEEDLDKTTRLNNREITFMAVNAVRDDAQVPRKTEYNPKGRDSISSRLRWHLKSMKISLNGAGRDDVKAVNRLTEEEAMANAGARLEL